MTSGKYKITAERGKEYFPQTKSVNVGSEPVKLVISLKRWINMAQLGWYSGDTHVHRTLEELPNVQLAEDLNVSFPLLYWVTKAFQPPSTYPLERIEIVVNGHVAKTVKARNPDKSGSLGAYSCRINENIDVATSLWIAIRCFERRPDGRSRFAHTAPFHVEVKGRPLQARKAEVDFLIKRMQKQIERNEGVLPEKALDEYRQALEIYQTIARSAK